MEDPNLLAFPSRDELGAKVRSCFVPREGFVFVSCDYSQIEPRVAAALSGDTRLRGIYERGEDLYTSTAAALFHIRPEQVTLKRHRLPAKTTTLGVLYGIGETRLYEELVKVGCGEAERDGHWEPYFNAEDCQDLISEWFALYPDVRRLAQQVCQEARSRDGIALTQMGRKRHLPALFLQGSRWPEEKLRQEAERQAFNHLIQGTAQEIIKTAMVRVGAEPNLPAFPLLQIHDELLFETPKFGAGIVASRIEALMSDILLGVSLPAKATIAADWGQLK
jgi:DNA polymerase-1